MHTTPGTARLCGEVLTHTEDRASLRKGNCLSAGLRRAALTLFHSFSYDKKTEEERGEGGDREGGREGEERR